MTDGFTHPTGRSIGYYMVDIVKATRDSARVQVGASPRGSLALLKLSRCRAALDGRDFVTPDDVKSVTVPALTHRLMLRPELWVQRVSSDDVVRQALESVPTPPAHDVNEHETLVACIWAAVYPHAISQTRPH
jgi:MoxR-like ATPase